MGFEAIKGYMIDDLAYDVLAEIQTHLNKEIYFLEEMYYEGTEEGETRVIEGMGVDDLGVERHLKPMSSTPDVEVASFDGEVKVTVSVINEGGKRKNILVPLEVEYENNEESIEFGEYFAEFVEESYYWIQEEMKGTWLESDEGDFIEHREVAKNLEDKQVIILDRDLFLDAVGNKYGKKYINFEKVQDKGIKDIIEDIRSKVTGNKVYVVNKFRVGFSKIYNFDVDGNFMYVRYMYDLREGRTERTIKSERIMYVEGKDVENMKNKIGSYFEKINADILKGNYVAVEIPLKEGKTRIELVDIDKNIGEIYKTLETNNEYTVIFTKGSYRRYVNDADIYVLKQNERYKEDEWYKNVISRFEQATKVSKRMRSQYLNVKHTFRLEDLEIGPHYAILRNKEGFKVLYNIKEENISIQKVRNKIGNRSEKERFMHVVLDIVDGRKRLSEDRIKQTLGG